MAVCSLFDCSLLPCLFAWIFFVGLSVARFLVHRDAARAVWDPFDSLQELQGGLRGARAGREPRTGPGPWKVLFCWSTSQQLWFQGPECGNLGTTRAATSSGRSAALFLQVYCIEPVHLSWIPRPLRPARAEPAKADAISLAAHALEELEDVSHVPNSVSVLC